MSYGGQRKLELGGKRHSKLKLSGNWNECKPLLHGLSTVNYIEDYWYTYLPGYGQMTEAQCLKLADLTAGYRCMTAEECKTAGRVLSARSEFQRCDSFDKVRRFSLTLSNPSGKRLELALETTL